ncbi:methyltransferase domain-containing protein, partial [bacterium]|nr:methyltransferase domain-containing protein [bacterium]
MAEYKTLEDIICCPACRNKLFFSQDLFCCNQCNTNYLIKDGILVLLRKEDFKLADDFGKNYIGYDSNENDLYLAKFLSKEYIAPLWNSKISKKTVLELGSGAGQQTRLIEDVFDCFICTDLSYEALLKLKQYKKSDKYFFVQTNINQFPFRENSLDVILSTGVLHYVKDKENIFGSIYKTLRYNGEYIGIEPNEYIRWYKTYLRLF